MLNDVEELSLLLVEDDRADAILVEELIADAGFDARVVWAESAAKAGKRSPSPGQIASCWICICTTPTGSTD